MPFENLKDPLVNGSRSDEEDSDAEQKLDERAFENAKHDDQAEAEVGEQQADLTAELPDDIEDLELTHSRLRSLQGLQLDRFATTLTRLCLRQNLLTSLYVNDDTAQDQVAPLEGLANLSDLDLYDNKLSAISGVSGLSKLRTLDFSFNLIKALPAEVFATLTSLQTLYLVQNKISRIEGLDSLAQTLTSLELGGNRLRTIANLHSLTNLTELWLGKNKITKLENIETLVNLKILSIQSNRLTVLEGLDTLSHLEELYVSHNGLAKISGLRNLLQLRVLDIASNKIEHLENVSHMAKLEEFWANGNKLDSLEEVKSQLSHLQSLETVYFEANPLQKSLGTTYRRKLIDLLPQVSQIDATFARQA